MSFELRAFFLVLIFSASKVENVEHFKGFHESNEQPENVSSRTSFFRNQFQTSYSERQQRMFQRERGTEIDVLLDLRRSQRSNGERRFDRRSIS